MYLVTNNYPPVEDITAVWKPEVPQHVHIKFGKNVLDPTLLLTLPEAEHLVRELTECLIDRDEALVHHGVEAMQS